MAKIVKEDEYIDEVLGFDIQVLTNKGNKKIIRFLDLRGHEDSELQIDRDSGCTIAFKIKCHGYSMIFIEEEDI